MPLLSQWGTGANHRIRDCGVADVAMLLAFYGKLGNLTVDDLTRETPLEQADAGLMPAQLVALAKRNDLDCRAVAGVTLDQVRAEIDGGRPVIALISYEFVLGRLDQRDRVPGSDGHFIVLCGYSDDHFIANDSDYWWPYVGRGHDTQIPINQLEQALAPYGNACVFVENVPLTDQIIALAKQIEAVAAQLAIVPPTPPATEPIVAVVVKANGTNIRNGPTTGAAVVVPNGLPAGTALNVQDVKVNANGHNWYRVADGQWQGDYIAQEVTTPKV